MTPATVIRFLLGHGPSIDALARSRSAVWTGLVLVLLTAIARQYDQTLVTR